MPLRRLPPLSALRAFEAAARRMSFKAAADELSVTAGAISQQIKTLEADLGAPLFVRKTRAVELTQEGALLQPEVSTAFLQLRQAIDAVRPQKGPALRINTLPSVVIRFLLPRLHQFSTAFPDIDYQIESQSDINPMDRTGPDIVIRFGYQPPPELYSRTLFQEMLIPAASPEFIETKNINSPHDLLHAPLLSDAGLTHLGHDHDWKDWFKLAGVAAPPKWSGLHFTEFAGDHVIEAAVAGSGFALVRGFIAHGALSEGRLTCPFGPILKLDLSYYVACRKGREKESHIKAFMDWVEGQAAAMSTLNAMLEPSA